MKGNICGLLIVLCSILFFSSCISPKSITYFKDLGDSGKISLDSLKVPEPVILVNDVLEIRVGGENQETVQYLNSYFGGVAGGVANTGLQFTVDINGNIYLPKIGKIKMAGLTRDQARDTLTGAYKQYLLNPVVSVKFSNFHFSVLGEVKSPGNYTSTNDKLSIFEALAQAGDITEFGHFDNVKILRDINGKREIITLNLLSKSILNSPDYYIKRYDIIYVQSRSLKSVTDNFGRSATFIATITSVLAIFFALFKK
jgi:polysaccharide export outer membrane protein